MTDNQDRQFSQDQGSNRPQQQNAAGQQGQQQQSQYGQQGQQDPEGQYGQRDQQQDQYRGQDQQQQQQRGQGQQGSEGGTSASGITGQRDDSSGISGGAPAGQGGGAEQYGMESARASNQQQQEVGHDQKIQEDHDSRDGQHSGGGGYGN